MTVLYQKMSTEADITPEKIDYDVDVETQTLVSSKDMNYLKGKDISLDKKMDLINDAIDEIGFTWFHFYLFCLAGFGYAADSLISMIQSAVQTAAVYYQYDFTYPISTQFCYAGLFFGALVIGFSADLIGRKIAFNCSLLLSALFGFMAGGSSSLAMYMVNMFLANFFLGGNLALDVTLLMEFLPHKYQYLNTFMACWWGIGQTICELLAWAFIPNFTCNGRGDCLMSDNRGWRYTWYTGSAIVLILALSRILLFNMLESPKHLASQKRDAEALEVLQTIANKYNRPLTLTQEQLDECGQVSINEDFYENPTMFNSLKQMWGHVKLLFLNKTVIRSNIILIISWFGVGITYGIYNNFLYAFLAAHGANTGTTTFEVYRDATIETFLSTFGPVIAAGVLLIPGFNRRIVMCIGGVSAMIVLMCYTVVRAEGANVVVASISYITINMYYGTLYAYTPEVLPTLTRATGASLCLAANRVAGMLVPVIYYFSNNKNSSAPIYVCGAIIGAIGVLSLALPFEPSQKRSM